MPWIFLGISDRKFHGDDFAEGKSEEAHNDSTVLLRQYERPGNAFITMLSRGGFEKSIKLCNTAVKAFAVMLFR